MSNWFGRADVTAPMEAADRAMDAAIDNAAAAMHAADELMEKLESNETPAADEEIEQFRDYVTGPGRTPEWLVVSRRVQEGETTWRAIVEGQLQGDEQVEAAFRSLPPARPLEPGERQVADASAPNVSITRPMTTNDDEYFDDFSPFN